MDHKVDAAIATTESVLFDAIYIPGGAKAIDSLLKEAKFIKFINEAFKHCKAIAADGDGERLIDSTVAGDHKTDATILINANTDAFINAIARHRNWDRMDTAKTIPV